MLHAYRKLFNDCQRGVLSYLDNPSLTSRSEQSEGKSVPRSPAIAEKEPIVRRCLE